VLCPEKVLVDYFEEAVEFHNNPKAIANFVANDLLREVGSTSLEVACAKISPRNLAELVKLIDDGSISKQSAKEIFAEMYANGESPDKLVQKHGLQQNSNIDELRNICRSVIEANAKAANEFLAGKEPAINVLKGQVLKATQGKANPQLIDKTMRELLKLT
jgi:aspartyl-tRNA(Asn)/glutamyl-tRNA(Gln) amidotransferase subunit B